MRWSSQHATDVFPRIHELVEINAGVQTHAVQHVHDIFRRDIARGTPRVRTTSESRHGRVHRGNPMFQRGKYIDERLTAEDNK